MSGRGGSAAFSPNIDPGKLPRKARAKELSAVAELECEVVHETFGEILSGEILDQRYNPAAAAKDLEQLVGPDHDGELFVVGRVGKPVAMASLTADGRNGIINHFYCRHQRAGYGAALIISMAEEAMSRGLTSICIEVLPQNQQAVRFFAKLGFGLRSYGNRIGGVETWQLARSACGLTR